MKFAPDSIRLQLAVRSVEATILSMPFIPLAKLRDLSKLRGILANRINYKTLKIPLAMSFRDSPYYGILPLRVRVLFKYSIANKLQNPQNSFSDVF
jgi:hypothetical protein